MKAFAVYEDGTRLEAKAPERAPLADQVAFERHFGCSVGVLAKYQDLADLDPKDIDPNSLPPVEQVAFLVWRVLLRAQVGAPDSFDSFLDLAVEVGYDANDEGPAGLDPTTTVPAARVAF